jgi:isopenicillin-N epimerase
MPRIQLHTSLDPERSCAIGTVGIEDIPPGEITQKLWQQWRIIVTPINHAEYAGVRVTPNVYTTLADVDTFADAMETLARA